MTKEQIQAIIDEIHGMTDPTSYGYTIYAEPEIYMTTREFIISLDTIYGADVVVGVNKTTGATQYIPCENVKKINQIPTLKRFWKEDGSIDKNPINLR